MKRAFNNGAASGTEVDALVPLNRMSVGPAALRAPFTVASDFMSQSTHPRFRIRGPYADVAALRRRQWKSFIRGARDWTQKQTVVACVRIAQPGAPLQEVRSRCVLESHFQLILANAAHVKNVPGRKTDVNDAMWLPICWRTA